MSVEKGHVEKKTEKKGILVIDYFVPLCEAILTNRIKIVQLHQKTTYETVFF